MNKSEKICKLRDKLELDYLALAVIRNYEKYIDNITIIDVLIQTHRIPIIRNLQETLRRKVKELNYE